MTRRGKRPFLWLAAAVGAQIVGTAVLAGLQIAAFVAPPSVGEATAVGFGYVTLVTASTATAACGSIAAFAAVTRLRGVAAATVTLLAASVVFAGVAEFYATLAMLAVW